jgi:hypothetical protein
MGWLGGAALAVECLPRKCEVLSSDPVHHQKKNCEAVHPPGKQKETTYLLESYFPGEIFWKILTFFILFLFCFKLVQVRSTRIPTPLKILTPKTYTVHILKFAFVNI